ncbi:MAG: RsmB/NOP family class I SAM-dependent RNA methyltransferase [Alphaproteobacteria bacterium]
MTRATKERPSGAPQELPARRVTGRKKSALSARGGALELVEAVLVRKRFLDDALDHMAMPAGRDRAFAHALALMTLRRLGQIDALLDHCLARPLEERAHRTRNLLRLGAAQLAFLGTPAHAAVAESVDLAEQCLPAVHKGLVNAVLRRLSREAPSLLAAHDAARLNTPGWMWDSWQGAYGETRARAIAEAHLIEPPLDISVRGDASVWAARLGAEELPTGTLRLAGGGRVEELAGFADGAWWIQDAASALPARLLGDVAGKSVVDLCAAPGGKTAQLASVGARVVAIERSAGRASTLEANLARLRLPGRVVVADAEAWRPEALADAVLLDAPCSATGTIRRHPDVQRLKTPGDVARLAHRQSAMLDAALAMVRSGGTLVYAVCSLESAECAALVNSWLASNPPVSRLPVRADEVGGQSEFIDPHGNLRTLPGHWPERGGLDGFFAARFVRH